MGLRVCSCRQFSSAAPVETVPACDCLSGLGRSARQKLNQHHLTQLRGLPVILKSDIVRDVISARRRTSTKRIKGPSVRLSAAQLSFEEAADRIQAEFVRRKGANGLRPFESANGYFKRAAYALIRRTIAQPGGAGTIKNAIRRFSRLPNSPSYRQNPFYWGLLAIDPYLDTIKQRQYLSLYAQQLLYAHRNAVGPEYLIGFLYQTASQRNLPARLAAKRPDESLLLESLD